MASALTVIGVIERRMVSVQLYLKLYNLLWHREVDETAHQVQLTLPTDPLGSQRTELAQIADDLSAVARRLDAHQPRVSHRTQWPLYYEEATAQFGNS